MLKNQQGPSAARLWLVFALVCAPALALDLGTKQWAWEVLRGGRAVVVIDRLLELAFAHNQGTSFGVVRQVDYPLMWLAFNAIVIGWVVATLRLPGAGRLRFAGAGLIVSGALGNLHDRLWRADEFGRHGVVDFIKVNYPWGGSWPNFNVADAALVFGTVALAWSLRERQARAGGDGSSATRSRACS